MEENKQQIKGLLYEQDDINKAFALLNTILVSGEQQVKDIINLAQACMY